MCWHTNVEYLDSLVKDYLTLRGFINTVKAMEADLKQDNAKGFRIEKIMHHIISLVQSSDIEALKKYWEYLSSKFITVCYAPDGIVLRKMEVGLYRFYIVHIIQNSKTKDITTFFQKMTPHLQQFSEWKEWFALPFLVNPESNPTFSPYFSKQWIDTFLVSMHNFLSAIFSRLPPPLLVKAFIDDGIQIQHLEKELTKYNPSITTLPTSNSLHKLSRQEPNYGKSKGLPGALSHKTEVITQPIKKKSPFSFGVKKEQKPKPGNPTLNGNKPNEYKSSDLRQSTSSKSIVSASLAAQRRELLSSSTRKINIPNCQPFHEPKLTSTEVKISSSPLKSFLSRSPDIKSSYEIVQNHSQSDFPADHAVDIESSSLDQSPFIVLSKDTFLEHHSSIVQCRFDSKGTTVASIDDQGVVKAWQYEPQLKTLATVMFRKPILCIQWCKKPDYLLLLGTSSGTIRFFNTATNMTHEDIQVHEKYSRVMLISTHPAGTSFTASCVKPQSDDSPRTASKGILQVWDVRANQIKFNRCLNGDKLLNEVTCMEFNHNGNLLLTGDVCGNIVIFDMNTYDMVHTWDAHFGSVYGLEFSIDENRVFTFSVEGVLKALDLNKVDSPPVLYSLPSNLDFSYDDIPMGRVMTFDPEGKYLIICGGNEAVILEIDEASKSVQVVFRLPSHKSSVVVIDWTSNNSCGHCLTGSTDGRIQVTTLLSQDS